MRRVFACVILAVVCIAFAGELSALGAGETPAVSIAGVQPDTWVAVDGLGRTVSTYEDVGDVRKDKIVGCFYWLWFELWKNYEPRNITQIIQQYPEAAHDLNHPAWENAHEFWWNEPLFGYYQNLDQYVLRKHAELLADAGIDVLIFDCTNGSYTFQQSFNMLMRVFEEAKADGVNVPKFMFMSNFDENADSKVQMRSWYKQIYEKGKYKDLWFYWEGKPMILAHSKHLDKNNPTEKAISEFFTFRRNEPTFFCDDTYYDTNQSWGWLSVYPQTKFCIRDDGSVEQMCVGVAQNALMTKNGKEICVAQNDARGGVYGRGYAKGDYSYSYVYQNKTITIDKNTKDAYLYGLNFQQQWDYALEVDPDFVFVTGWNEWFSQRRSFEGTENGFSDNYTDEYSRDIEPSKGVLKDYYYYQLVDNVRKYKGVSKPVVAEDACKTIDINSEDDPWASVTTAYNHYVGSTRDRNIDGAKGTHYTNHTMRNDIVTSKVAYDADNIYFMVETLEDLTDCNDPAWMRLLLDTDDSGVSPNWEGFEYIFNRTSPSGGEMTVERSKGGWNFESVGKARFSVSGKRLQIAVPRSVLGLNGSDLNFNFKWADNTWVDGSNQDSGDILDFYQYGDVAPGGRFMFAFTAADADISQSDTLPAYVWWIVAGGAAFVLAAAIVVVVVLKKENVYAE